MFKLGFSSKLKKLAEFLGLRKNQVASADLPCGYTCPMADKCKSFSNPVTGKIHDAPTCEYRCYGASLESAFTPLRKLHWNNFDLVRIAKSSGAITDILLVAMVDTLKVMRIHSFGDFFTPEYFQAWVNVAEKFPKIDFFAYTKMLPYMSISRPDNFSMVYSYGGKLDHMRIDEPTAYVVKSVADAEVLGVPVSCQTHPTDDYNFVKAGKSFGLVLHGTQPAGFYTNKH